MNAVVVAGLAGLAGVGGVVGISEIAPDRQAPEPTPRVAAVLPTGTSDDAELGMIERAERAVAAAEARASRLERDRPVATPPIASSGALAPPAGSASPAGRGADSWTADHGSFDDDHDDDGDWDDHDDDHEQDD